MPPAKEAAHSAPKVAERCVPRRWLPVRAIAGMLLSYLTVLAQL